MSIVAIDREIALTIEDDVVVDDDLGFHDHRCRAVTRKGIWTPARGDGVANPLLRARENGAGERALAILTCASAALRAFGYGFVAAQSVRGVARVIRAIFAVVAIGIRLAALLTIFSDTDARQAVKVNTLGSIGNHQALVGRP